MTHNPTFRFCTACGVTFNTTGYHCPRCDVPAPLLILGPMFRAQMKPELAPWTIRPVAAWFDLWVGFYFDREKRRLYAFPFPMLGFFVQLPPPVPGLIELRQRETNRHIENLRTIRKTRAVGKSCPQMRVPRLFNDPSISDLCPPRTRPTPPPAPPKKSRLLGFAVAEGWEDAEGFHFGPTPTGKPANPAAAIVLQGTTQTYGTPDARDTADALNLAANAAGFQLKLSPEVQTGGKLDWTATADLDAPEHKPGTVARIILRFLDFCLTLLHEKPCTACGRESSGTRPDGKSYCARCLADLETLRERRRTEHKRNR